MHVPVMLEEVLSRLTILPDGRYLDCTLGGGGHAHAILQRLGEHGRLLGIDRDPAAVERCRSRLGKDDRRVSVCQANFADLADVAREAGMESVDGVVRNRTRAFMPLFFLRRRVEHGRCK